MKWASILLVGALAVSVMWLGVALAGGEGKEKSATKAFEKTLDKMVVESNKFLKKHGDSDEAATARQFLGMVYIRYGSTDWVKAHLKDAKAFLKDLEEREDRMARSLKGRLMDIEIVGQAPPAIDTTDFAGEAISLEDYKGKVLLIDFWATWCPPCIRELPNVKKVYDTYHDQGFDILGVSLDDDKKALEDFIKNEDMPWRQIYDGQRWKAEVAVLYGVKSIPKTYLLDRDGRVVQIGLKGEALGKAVAKLIGGKAEM